MAASVGGRWNSRLLARGKIEFCRGAGIQPGELSCAPLDLLVTGKDAGTTIERHIVPHHQHTMTHQGLGSSLRLASILVPQGPALIRGRYLVWVLAPSRLGVEPTQASSPRCPKRTCCSSRYFIIHPPRVSGDGAERPTDVAISNLLLHKHPR
jgi:hypothetical protein